MNDNTISPLVKETDNKAATSWINDGIYSDLIPLYFTDRKTLKNINLQLHKTPNTCKKTAHTIIKKVNNNDILNPIVAMAIIFPIFALLAFTVYRIGHIMPNNFTIILWYVFALPTSTFIAMFVVIALYEISESLVKKSHNTEQKTTYHIPTTTKNNYNVDSIPFVNIRNLKHKAPDIHNSYIRTSSLIDNIYCQSPHFHHLNTTLLQELYDNYTSQLLNITNNISTVTHKELQEKTQQLLDTENSIKSTVQDLGDTIKNIENSIQ